jgi:hypothetical protein
MKAGAFGPWRNEIEPVERIAQLRSLAALAAIYLGSNHNLVVQLRNAENNDEALKTAGALLDRIPALTRRRLLATFGAITWPQRRAP